MTPPFKVTDSLQHTVQQWAHHYPHEDPVLRLNQYEHHLYEATRQQAIQEEKCRLQRFLARTTENPIKVLLVIMDREQAGSIQSLAAAQLLAEEADKSNDD